jgi:UDPglucose 6-dehydrogenase
VSAPIVGFAGLTHLGLVSAAASAAKGFRTIGFDPDRERVAALKAGSWPISEPQFPELMTAHASVLSWTASTADLGACDLLFVAADVPTDEAGASALGPIQGLIAAILPALAPHALLIVLCQVPPGFTRSIALASRRRFYQVETLVFGRAVERALRPERFIIGADDPAAPLPAAYRSYLESFSCPLLPMRYESAELAKISINCCLVASVTVANTLAELSERIGADWSEIVPALKLDARIGPQAYLAPGLGLAGGNLERDLATVRRLAGETGSEAGLIDAMLLNSNHRRDWALRTLHEQLLSKMQDPVIGVLGLAYKENTHSTKNSPSLALIRHLRPWRLRVFDPVVPASAAEHPQCVGCDTAMQAAEGADGLVIATPWPEFRCLSAADVAARMRGRVIVDPYRVLAPEEAAAAGLRHFVLGAPPPRARAAEPVHA